MKSSSLIKKKIVIIGGGLSGLALATELCKEGCEVVVLEKNKFLGGRASNTVDETTHEPMPIGPHIFLAGYNNFLHFLDKIGAAHLISWERRLFIDVIYNGRHHQATMAKLPFFLWTIPLFYRYPFLSWKDKLSNLRFVITAFFMNAGEIEKLDHINVSGYLKSKGVSEKSINTMWRFFVLSMLNVPIELCSAAEFLYLIKFWGKLKRRAIGFAKVGLGDLYTKKAHAYIEKNGGKVLTSTTVDKIVFDASGNVSFLCLNKNEKMIADVYISSLNPVDLRKLLPEEVLLSEFFRSLNAFEGVSYISVHLWFDRKITNKKFWALLTDQYPPRNINIDFYDYSNIYSAWHSKSYIASNIIFSKPYDAMSNKDIIAKTLAELQEIFPTMDAKLEHSEVNRIPYAIYAPYPGMRQHKLPHKTPIENFYLTGDWTVRDVTQCMEGAVRSGYRCAEQILADFGVKRKICHDDID